MLDEKGSLQDATTLTKNNANIAYDAEMAANLQLIQDGISNNIVDNQKLINEYNEQLTKGTSIKNTDVSLVEGLFNENYLKADATTNITNKTDIYLDKDAQKNTVNLVTHEDAHQAGFGEKSANALGWMGETAFNVNSWVNSSNIDTAKTQIQNIPKVEVAGVNDAQAQLNLLKANTEKYESQIANNDEFDEHLTNKRFADLQKYLEICKTSSNANGCSQADKNKLVAKIKQISADNLSVYKSCKASGQSACMEKNVQQIWAAEQFDDNKLKQLLGSTNVGLASNYDVKAADPQLFKQLEFLQYAQKNCQGMSYGDCGTKYTVSHRSAAENILIPAKSKVLDYIVGEKPRSGASYYLAGIGYVATEILFPESGIDVALMTIGGAATKGAKLASAEAKAGENLASITESQYKHLTCSFRGDMQVKTNHGYTPIQQISVGDWVYSLNETTGKGSYKQVLAQYSNPYKETVYVTVKSKAGQQQTIVSNKIHPYFTVPYNDVPQSSEGHIYHGVVKGGKWVDASNLKVGYKLLVSNNEWYEVISVDIKSEALQAYNLTVDTNHTYFIKGLNVNLDGVWVHNNCNLDDIQNIKYGKAEIVKKTNGSLEINYTNATGTNLKWTPQTEKDIQRSIDSKSKSAESGDIAEAKVAKIVQTSGEKISGFGVQVKNNKNQHIGDADIITEKYFIEVKKSDSAIKKNQVAKYVDENNPNFFNTNGKQVIIYIDEGGLGSEARKLKNQYGDKIKIVSGKSELENILRGN